MRRFWYKHSHSMPTPEGKPDAAAPTAVLDLRAHADAWDAQLLGLPIVVRALLALQFAGFREATLVGGGAGAAAARFRAHRAAEMPVRVADEVPAAAVRSLVFDTPVVAPSGTMRALAERASDGPLSVPTSLPDGVTGYLVPARTRAERREASRTIRRALRKPMIESGMVSVVLQQRIGLQVCRVLSRTPFTPNQLTIVGGLIGAASLPLLWHGGRWPVIIGVILLYINDLFDGFDGLIARMKYQFSPFGDKLDHSIDDALKAAILAPTGMGLYHQTGNEWWAIAGWIGTGSRVLYAVTMLYYVKRFGGPKATHKNLKFWYRVAKQGPSKPERRDGIKLRYFIRKDITQFSFLVFGIAGLIEVPFVFFTAGAVVYGAIAFTQLVFFHRRVGFEDFYRGET